MALRRRGRHARRGRSRGPAIRVVMVTLAGVCAGALAITLILAGSSGQAARTARIIHPRVLPHRVSVKFTIAQRGQLHRYLARPQHRAELRSLVERSIKQAGIRAGIGSVDVPGLLSLDLAYRVTGEGAWVIASIKDV
jgi:hypothetical protein